MGKRTAAVDVKSIGDGTMPLTSSRQQPALPRNLVNVYFSGSVLPLILYFDRLSCWFVFYFILFFWLYRFDISAFGVSINRAPFQLFQYATYLKN